MDRTSSLLATIRRAYRPCPCACPCLALALAPAVALAAGGSSLLSGRGAVVAGARIVGRRRRVVPFGAALLSLRPSPLPLPRRPVLRRRRERCGGGCARRCDPAVRDGDGPRDERRARRSKRAGRSAGRSGGGGVGHRVDARPRRLAAVAPILVSTASAPAATAAAPARSPVARIAAIAVVVRRPPHRHPSPPRARARGRHRWS